MYDIYLFTGVHMLPPHDELVHLVPVFNEPTALEQFDERIQQRTPRFLQLNLAAQDILHVFQYVRKGKAVGYILPIAYREPQISLEKALPIAEKAIAEMKATHYPEQSAVAVQFAREQPAYWTFSANYGRNKRLYAHIDKLDGHLWSRSDVERIWDMSYFLGKIANSDRVPYVVPTSQSDPQQTYDIFLVRHTRTIPDLERLVATIPSLQDSGFLQRITQQNMTLLPMDLPEKGALELLRSLEEEGALGSLLASAYRQPKITLEQAAPIAEQAIVARQAKQRPDDTLGPVRFFREEPCCWTFGASSAQLIREECIPGMVFASVDKLDGHIWKEEEFTRFLAED